MQQIAFKELAKITQPYIMPPCDPERMIKQVYYGSSPVDIHPPQKAKDLCCPLCGFKEGYYISFGQGWSCLSPECVALTVPANMKKTNTSTPAPKKSLKNCLFPDDFAQAEFSKCTQSQSVIIDLKKYCERFSGFIIFKGATGRGKTYAAACIAREFLERGGDSCLFFEAQSLYIQWLEACGEGVKLNFLSEKLSKVKLLIIDDLGVEKASDGYQSFFYSVINKRSCDSSLGTIISTNLSSHDPGGLVEIYGDRVFSRIASGMVILFQGNEDRRLTRF